MRPAELTISDWGLIVFVALAALDVAGLLLDLYLDARGIQTITQVIWGGAWYLGLTIVLIQLALPIALAVHFWGPHR